MEKWNYLYHVVLYSHIVKSDRFFSHITFSIAKGNVTNKMRQLPTI